MKKIIILLLFIFIFSFFSLALNEISLIYEEKETNKNKLRGYDLEIPQKKIPSQKIQTFFIEDEKLDFKTEKDEIRVIVKLKEPEKIWRHEISTYSESKINSLKSTMREHVIQNEINYNNLRHRFNFFNGFSAVITSEELERLKGNPLVERIEEDTKVEIFIQDTVDIINATSTWNLVDEFDLNLTGKGQSVCVIDTGVDYTHPDLGGCETLNNESNNMYEVMIASPNYPGYLDCNGDCGFKETIYRNNYDTFSLYFDDLDLGSNAYLDIYDHNMNLIGFYNNISASGLTQQFHNENITLKFETYGVGRRGFNITNIKRFNFTSVCEKVIGGYDFAYGTNDPMDIHGHGTHVAGTVAANGKIKGVAPDTNIVAVKSLSDDGEGWSSDIIAGIEYCIDKKEELNISVISMSLGGGNYSDYCDSNYTSYSNAINEATNAGISVVVATGNDGLSTNVSSPACIENAIRVGSTIKSDNALSGFSNRWALDMLVAPGSSITSTCVGGGTCTKQGTSMATPHVSGAITIINQFLTSIEETKNPLEINEILKDTGKHIFGDERTYYRIDIHSAILSLDNQPPLITINSPINNTYYNNATQLLNISVTDNFQVNKIWFNWNGTNETYNQHINITFNEGINNLTVWANDTAGNINQKNISFTIDTIAPILEEVIPIPNITNNPNPNYTFHSSKAGTIGYYDELCTSNKTNVSKGNNTITFNYLEDGFYDYCKIYIYDLAGNPSNILNISNFTIDTLPPNYIQIITKLPYVYNETNNYWFNISLEDISNVDNASLYLKYFGNDSFTKIYLNNGGDFWYYNETNLSIGTYHYRFWANDSFGNSGNVTSISTFTVADLNESKKVFNGSSNFKVDDNKTNVIVENSNTLKNITVSKNNSKSVTLIFNNRPDNKVTFTNNVTLRRQTSDKNLSVNIPSNTTMSSNEEWDGNFKLPKIKDISNANKEIGLAIKVGSNFELNFDKPIKIFLPGQGNKEKVAFMRNEIYTDITKDCINLTDPDIDGINNKNCKINNSEDWIIWTYHFTTFLAYDVIDPVTTTTTTTSGSSGGSGGGGGGGGGVPPLITTTTTLPVTSTTLQQIISSETTTTTSTTLLDETTTTTTSTTTSITYLEKPLTNKSSNNNWVYILISVVLLLIISFFIINNNKKEELELTSDIQNVINWIKKYENKFDDETLKQNLRKNNHYTEKEIEIAFKLRKSIIK